MREERTRRGRQVTPEPGTGVAARRLIVLLGIVAALLVGLVAYRYWPAWVGDLGRDLLDGALGHLERTWRQTGGRWVTLLAVVAAVAIGALLTRRSRTLGIAIIEVAVAVGAIAALIQPAGW